MQLTREEWKALDKAPIKERVERLEEIVDELEQDLSDMRMKAFEKELDAINDEADKKCLRVVIITFLLLGAALWAFITKVLI